MAKNLSSLSIDRPVLASVMSIVLVIFGIIGFTRLGVREFPSVDPPIVTVRTDYPGANADIIESQITEILEESISAVEGIKSVKSVSSDGRSSITVEFELGIDMNNAANDIRDKVSRAVRNLPPDADPPIVNKSDADAETIFSLTVQSDERSLLELTEIGINVFKERLQTIKGVSEIRIWGEKKYSMKLLMDPALLASYELTPLDVRDALATQNVELPSGRIEGHTTELTIRTYGRLSEEEEFNDLIVSEKNGQIVRFKDIGRAELRPENERTLLRGNFGVPMIGVAINPQPGANYIEIVDEVYERVTLIKNNLPEDIRLGVALDNTVNIRKGIEEVQNTVFIAFLLVLLVIFLFLRNWRTTLIPIVTIPISLVSIFFVMYISDFSINILSLLGIVMATGLVVDDAIVVMENIYTKIEEGMPPRKAAHLGAKEIIFAVISTTVTLVAVFLPIVFLEGLTGRLFREFGVVIAGAVVISSFVSLTLTPMMSARLLKKRERTNRLYRFSEKILTGLIDGYENSLRKYMKAPWLGILLFVVSLGIIIFFGAQLPSELAPKEDKSRLRIISSAPEGTSFEKMDAFQQDLIEMVDSLPETESTLSVTSPGFGSSISINSGFVRLTLVPPSERDKTQNELAAEISQKLKKHTFARVFVTQEETIGGGRNSGLPVQFVVQSQSLDSLKRVIPEFMSRASESEVFEIVDLDLKFNKPEVRVEINREKARQMGVSVLDISETLQLFFSGQRYGYFIYRGKQYQVIGQADREFRDEPSDMKYVYVRNNEGTPIPLENLIQVTSQISPPQLFRFNRFVAATFKAAPAEGYTLGQGIDEMNRIADEVLTEAFYTDLDGVSKEFRDSSSSVLFAFVFAMVLVYLVLAAQFESFLDPLIIMFTVPLAIAGAVLSLWMFDQTINIFSQIGAIVLIGLVTKNGILMVEFANQQRAKGLDKKEAIIEASSKRFRPIVMTSLATILGALPIALALGGASTSRIPLGIAIIGGLIFSLILTLYVIPSFYYFFSYYIKKPKDT